MDSQVTIIESEILPALPAPAQHIAETALQPQPQNGKKFKPTEFHRKLAEALVTKDPKNFADLSEKTGLSFSKLASLVEDPAACRWITENCAEMARLGLGVLYQQIFKKALSSEKPGWAELFLKRFDPDYQPKGSQLGAQNTQINVYNGYSDQELVATVRALRQQVLGEQDARG